MLIKIVKSLGCAYGCGEGHRGLSGDRLRMQVRLEILVSCLGWDPEAGVTSARPSLRLRTA